MSSMETEKKIRKKTKKSSFFRNFILILILFSVGIVFIMQERPQLFDELRKYAEIEGLPPVEEAVIEPELVEEALESDYSVGAEPPLLSFAPEEDINAGELEVEPADPYAKIVEKESKVEEANIQREAIKNGLNDYRLFLSNANELIVKFKANQPYELELNKARIHSFPSHVEAILSKLEKYNELLETVDDFAVEVEPFDSKLLARFVKVKKLPVDKSDKKILRDEIISNLPIFLDYIFSSSLQEKFISN